MSQVKTKDSTPVSSSEEMEYVTIPDTDLFDQPMQPIRNNALNFGPGVHLVSKDQASYIKERLKIFQQEQIRQLRPNADARVVSGLKPIGS